MISLAIFITMLLAIGLATYKVALAITANWRELKLTMLIVLLLALSLTAIIIYTDEHPGFKGKMLQAADWIFAGIYTSVFFVFFSGLYFLLRKKPAQ